MLSKILLLRYGTVAKHTSMHIFVTRYFAELALLLPERLLKLIRDTGENWLQDAPDAVLELASTGLLGEGLFSVKVKDITEQKAYTCIQAALDLRHIAHAEKKPVPPLTLEVINQWRDDIIEHVSAEVPSILHLPSRRAVQVHYRSMKVEGVQIVSGIVDLVELHVWARVKQIAVAAEALAEIDAEKLLGCKAVDLDCKVPVSADLLVKVAASIF